MKRIILTIVTVALFGFVTNAQNTTTVDVPTKTEMTKAVEKADVKVDEALETVEKKHDCSKAMAKEGTKKTCSKGKKACCAKKKGKSCAKADKKACSKKCKKTCKKGEMKSEMKEMEEDIKEVEEDLKKS